MRGENIQSPENPFFESWYCKASSLFKFELLSRPRTLVIDVTAVFQATNYLVCVRAKGRSTVDEAVAMSMSQFLVSELAIAKTFAHLAATTGDSTKRTRCISNARKAYDTVVEFLPRAPLSQSETDQIREELFLLRSKLEPLGENFSNLDWASQLIDRN